VYSGFVYPVDADDHPVMLPCVCRLMGSSLEEHPGV